MSNNSSISGPVEIRSDSKERVAYDLMSRIAVLEDTSDQQRASKSYWFGLYRQCFKAVSGDTLESILKEDQ
jgi:hypothetical protein